MITATARTMTGGIIRSKKWISEFKIYPRLVFRFTKATTVLHETAPKLSHSTRLFLTPTTFSDRQQPKYLFLFLGFILCTFDATSNPTSPDHGASILVVMEQDLIRAS